jgi:uncharacterized protein YhbP (UPF0306 family)
VPTTAKETSPARAPAKVLARATCERVGRAGSSRLTAVARSVSSPGAPSARGVAGAPGQRKQAATSAVSHDVALANVDRRLQDATRLNLRESMAIKRSNRPLAAARIAATARQLLDASTLCAIATVTPSGRAHTNTAYFAWSRDFDIVWLAEPRATHSRNLRANDSAAIAVYDSSQTWGKPDRGIQLFGSAHVGRGEDAEHAETRYTKRFSDFAGAHLSAYRFNLLRPRRLKLFDERALGAATFVTARIARDRRLAWERTEIYPSTA